MEKIQIWNQTCFFIIIRLHKGICNKSNGAEGMYSAVFLTHNIWTLDPRVSFSNKALLIRSGARCDAWLRYDPIRASLFNGSKIECISFATPDHDLKFSTAPNPMKALRQLVFTLWSTIKVVITQKKC